MRVGRTRHLRDRLDESIAGLGYGFDVPPAVVQLAEGLPQQRDIPSEVDFFDDGIRPEALHECLFRDQAPVRLYQGNEGIEELGRERHRLIAAQQTPLRRVQPKRAERVDRAL